VRSRRARWLDGRRSGESVLSERFARGEIDEEEYARRLRVLSGTAPASGAPPAG